MKHSSVFCVEMVAKKIDINGGISLYLGFFHLLDCICTKGKLIYYDMIILLEKMNVL